MSKASKDISFDTLNQNAVSDLYGLKVYTDNGRYIGTIEDVRLDFSDQSITGLALKDVSPEIRESTRKKTEPVVIPYGWVQSVHDIVITIDIVERLESDE